MCHGNGVGDKDLEKEEKNITPEELKAMEEEDEKESKEIVESVGIIMRWGNGNVCDERVSQVLLSDKVDCELSLDQLWEMFYRESSLVKLLVFKQILKKTSIYDMSLKQLDLAKMSLEKEVQVCYPMLFEGDEMVDLETQIAVLLEDRIHQKCKSMNLADCGIYAYDGCDKPDSDKLFSLEAKEIVSIEHQNKFFEATGNIQSFDDCIALKKHMLKGTIEERWLAEHIYTYYPKEALKEAEKIKNSIRC